MSKIHVVKRKKTEKFEQWKLRLFSLKRNMQTFVVFDFFVFRVFEIRYGHVLLFLLTIRELRTLQKEH